MSEIGELIRSRRSERGLTQRQLAAMVGIDFTYLSKIENNRLENGQAPKEAVLRRLAEALELDFHSLCLQAGKLPKSISQRLIQNADLLRSAWIDDSLQSLLETLECDVGQRVDEALAHANAFLRGVIDSLTSHIAVLNPKGEIVAVNAAWENFGRENGLQSADYGIGTNYLTVCDSATGWCSEGADVVADSIRKVINGSLELYETEYACHSNHEQRWFRLRISRFSHLEDIRIVTTHDDVTLRKLATRQGISG